MEKSLDKNNDNLNKQFDSLGSQSITQRLSDIRVVSLEKSRRNSGNNYSFSARSGSQSPRRDQTHNRSPGVFIVMNLVIFKQLVLSAHQGDSTDQRLHLKSPSRYQTSGGKKESNCWGLLTVTNLQSHVLMAAQMWVILFAKIISSLMNHLNLILLVHMQAVRINI